MRSSGAFIFWLFSKLPSCSHASVADYNSRIPKDEHEFDKNTGAIATGTRIGRRGDCVITKLSPEQRSEVALEGRGRAVGEEDRSEEIAMNGRTANGLLIQGVCRDVEAGYNSLGRRFFGASKFE